jgi:hypothetical protein
VISANAETTNISPTMSARRGNQRPLEQRKTGKVEEKVESGAQGRTEDVEDHERDVVLVLGYAQLEVGRETGNIGVSDGGTVDEVEKEEEGDLREDEHIELAQETLLGDGVDSELLDLREKKSQKSCLDEKPHAPATQPGGQRSGNNEVVQRQSRQERK